VPKDYGELTYSPFSWFIRTVAPNPSVFFSFFKWCIKKS